MADDKDKPATPPPPQYISREEQERVINEGGSVLFHQPGGSTLLASKLEHLPHASEIAARSKSPEAIAKARTDLETQIAALEAQKATLDAETAKLDELEAEAAVADPEGHARHTKPRRR